jgi:hypothetical protein
MAAQAIRTDVTFRSRAAGTVPCSFGLENGQADMNYADDYGTPSGSSDGTDTGTELDWTLGG